MFENNAMKIYIAAVVFIAVVAVFITVITHLPDKNEQAPEAINYSEEKLSFEDFMLPDEYKVEFKQELIPARESPEKWSWAQIEEYWTDPEKMAIEFMEKENEKTLEDIFEKVP